MAADTTYDLKGYFDFTRCNDDDYISECNLKCKHYNGYTILKYNKQALQVDDSLIGTLGLFRSVIVNSSAQVVSFAPPKAYSKTQLTSEFTEEEQIRNLQYEEFIEGTMINVFYDDEKWQIASRSLIGAKGQFFKGGKTFDRMFYEALEQSSFSFDDLNKSYCYSFVLQHPENRIVRNTRQPKLYLCEVYEITDNVVVSVDFRSDDSICDKVNVPEKYYDYTSWEEVEKTFNHRHTPYYVQGVVVKDGNRRFKIRNEVYENVRQLRGNQPKSQFQYISLRRAGKVSEFLHFYPEFKEEFARYRSQIHEFTNTLFQNYISCYIKKEKPLREFPGEYRTHMYTIHQKYINELMPEGKYVTLYVVMTYVNTLEAPRLMYSVNYKLRQRNVDRRQEEVQQQQS